MMLVRCGCEGMMRCSKRKVYSPVRRRRQDPVRALSRSKLKMRTLMGGFRF